MAKMMVGKAQGPGGPVGIAALAPDAGPDLSAVGNAASASKADTGPAADLQEFTVKKGDDGGVVICETTVAAPPPGRRVGASFPQQGSYLETPYAPDAAADAMGHVTDLLSQLGVAPSAAPPEPPPDDEMSEAPPMPPGGGGGPMPPMPPGGGGPPMPPGGGY